MRRLSLILSDLYLPADADVLPVAATLPNLEWLLSLAGHRRVVPEWRQALAADLGRVDLMGESPAQIAAHDRFPEVLAKGGWLATPVNFEARLDHVRLTPQGLLSLAPQERAAWCAQFATAFGPELSLHEAGPRAFLLTGLPALTVQTLDPARFLGDDISKGLPVGPDANRLRRLGTEIEMWAHGCALNREREKRRQPLLSGLWLWGGHGLAPADRGNPAPPSSLCFAGEDACLAGLSRLTTGREPAAIPESLDDFAPEAEYRVAELMPMTNAKQSLAHLDVHWFAPARAALKKGRLLEIRIFANDRIFHVVNRDRLTFWRRRYSWIESLRRTAQMPKA
jgi:hypothetical protein